MQGGPFAKNFTVATGIHVFLILAVLITPFFFRKKKKKPVEEIITYVNFGAPAPPSIQPVEQFIPPESTPPPPDPAPPEPPVPAPPAPEPPPIPEPPKEPQKPKEKLKKPDEIKKSENRIRRPDKDEKKKPDKPKLTEEQIRKQLQGSTEANPANTSADFPGWYYALVKQAMYESWDRPGPGDAEDGLSARVRIRVEKDGRISQRTLERGSGNPVMDQSVMRAAKGLEKIRALPSEFSGTHKEITIDFVLRL